MSLKFLVADLISFSDRQGHKSDGKVDLQVIVDLVVLQLAPEDLAFLSSRKIKNPRIKIRTSMPETSPATISNTVFFDELFGGLCDSTGLDGAGTWFGPPRLPFESFSLKISSPFNNIPLLYLSFSAIERFVFFPMISGPTIDTT
ncbi:hypothetical protein ACFX1Q_024629 [Malus domestica]